MKCGTCGTELQSEWTYCPSCSEPVSKKNEIMCSSCGETNAETANYCSGCGTLLNKNTAREIKTSGSGKSKPIPAKKEQQKRNTAEAKNLPQRFFIFFAAGLLLIAFVTLYFSGVLHSPNPPETTAAVEHAEHSHDTPDLSKLNEMNQLEQRLADNPADTTALVTLAHLQNDSRFWEKAIESYQRYLKINPRNAEVIIDMGVCYFNLKQFQSADSLMRAALKVWPNHVIGMYNLGIINLNWNRMDESKKWFGEVIKKHPASPQAAEAKRLLESH